MMNRASRSLLFLIVSIALSSCSKESSTPTSPSAELSTRPATVMEAAAAPAHILNPVGFGMIQGQVVFPPRNEPNIFFQNLQVLYRDTLRRTQTPTFVDPEGQNVWLTEYFRFYLNGCSHAEAMARTIQEITTGVTLPTCGAETLTFPPRNLPNEFQARLETTYRDVLRRPQVLSFVDSEGANVWMAQYLRLRTSGQCNHADAESKVFAEIRGLGVQGDCGPPYSRTGVGNTVFDLPGNFTRVRIQGTWSRRDTSNFIVNISGRLVVNEILRTSITYDGIHLVPAGNRVVVIESSAQISWTFTEVR